MSEPLPDHLLRRRRKGTGSIAVNGYLIHGGAKNGKYEHRAICERVRGGRPLPSGAEVHHIDGNKLNNAHSNLVICPGHGYHLLLHKRAEALRVTGDPNKRFCGICKTWDLESNMKRASAKRARTVHAECNRRYHRERKAAVSG